MSARAHLERLGDRVRIAYIKNPTGSMPHLYPGTLSDADVAAVAAYVMTLRH